MNRLTMFALIFLIIGNGCATAIKDKSSVNYVANSFNPAELRSGGLAMLPVVAGQGQEAFRRPLAEALSTSCALAMKPGRFLSWRETMQLLNDNDMSDEYQSMISTYRETSILRKETVSLLGELLECRYLLFVSLEKFHTQESTSYSFLSGNTYQRKSAVTAFCQTWDSQPGDVVWEGAASAKSVGGEMTYDKPYDEYARVAANGLVRRLFGQTTGSRR